MGPKKYLHISEFAYMRVAFNRGFTSETKKALGRDPPNRLHIAEFSFKRVAYIRVILYYYYSCSFREAGGGEGEGKDGGKGPVVVVCGLLYVPATGECISGTDLLRQFYVVPH